MAISFQPSVNCVRSVKQDLETVFTQPMESKNPERIMAIAFRVLGALVCFEAIKSFMTVMQTISDPLVILGGLVGSVFLLAIGHDIMMAGQGLSNVTNNPQAPGALNNSLIVALLSLI